MAGHRPGGDVSKLRQYQDHFLQYLTGKGEATEFTAELLDPTGMGLAFYQESYLAKTIKIPLESLFSPCLKLFDARVVEQELRQYYRDHPIKSDLLYDDLEAFPSYLYEKSARSPSLLPLADTAYLCLCYRRQSGFAVPRAPKVTRSNFEKLYLCESHQILHTRTSAVSVWRAFIIAQERVPESFFWSEEPESGLLFTGSDGGIHLLPLTEATKDWARMGSMGKSLGEVLVELKDETSYEELKEFVKLISKGLVER